MSQGLAAAGNTLTDANGRSYIYDGENKQVKASNGGGTLGEYFYDGDGKRVKKIVPSTGEVTVFVYDAAGKLVAEYSTVVESVEDAKVAYLTADHLSRQRINTDRDGKVTSRHDYHPYGEEIITAQRTAHDEYTPDTVRKQFTGYERDGETSLDFAQARYFGSWLGRFLSPDPLAASSDPGDPQTWSRYSYAWNNPLRLVDPTGMVPADYYAEDGKKVGSDGNAQDTNIYILKGTLKDNKDTKLTPGAAIATLPSVAARTAIGKMADRSQQSTNYYKGKESGKNDPYGNFHEEAVQIGTDSAGKEQIINTAPGAVGSATGIATVPSTIAANPKEQGALDTMIGQGRVTILAHSHPEGGQFPPPKPDSISTSGTFVNAGQPPSDVDVANASNRRSNIVTSTRENKVYFYNKGGTYATFPLDKFRKIGK